MKLWVKFEKEWNEYYFKEIFDINKDYYIFNCYLYPFSDLSNVLYCNSKENYFLISELRNHYVLKTDTYPPISNYFANLFTQNKVCWKFIKSYTDNTNIKNFKESLFDVLIKREEFIRIKWQQHFMETICKELMEKIWHPNNIFYS